MSTPEISPFRPGDPHTGYYSDQRRAAMQSGASPDEAFGALRRMTADREYAKPVSVSQLGLGAWQLLTVDPRWRDVLAHAVEWIVGAADEEGLLAHFFPLQHTYQLAAPWYSAMAQGEAASLLVRAARTLADDSLAEAAVLMSRPLVDAHSGLSAQTDAGPVLQEYVTDPPSHVLNGWISALWGVYDVSYVQLSQSRRDQGKLFRECFASGITTLEARLPLYRIGRGWSRYDLYPHPIANVASPSYHRLHVEQLVAMSRLVRSEQIQWIAREWQYALNRPFTVGAAVARKVAFRVIRPRTRRIAVPWNIRRAE